MSERHFKANTPPVIQETIDGETIMVNLLTGTYYQTREVGSLVWQAVIAGRSADEICDQVASAYGVEPETARRDLTSFLAELAEEGLVVPAEAPDRAAQRLAEGAARVSGYQPPRLLKFTDMQDLLLLDPVHEVDETGWPAASA